MILRPSCLAARTWWPLGTAEGESSMPATALPLPALMRSGLPSPMLAAQEEQLCCA